MKYYYEKESPVEKINKNLIMQTISLIFPYIVLALDLICFLVSILVKPFKNVIDLFFIHCLKEDCFICFVLLYK